MTLRFKLILVSVILIIMTLASAGLFGYRQSRWHIKELAKELLVAKTNHAYELCDQSYQNFLDPTDKLKEIIAHLEIADDGYVAVISNETGINKGRLIVHPTSVGKILYNEEFSHIKKMIDDIDENNFDGYSGFIAYNQGTVARGRQGAAKIGYFKYLKEWEWVILSTGYVDDVFSNRYELRTTLSLTVIALMLSGILVVSIIIRQMFVPVQRLTESTKEVARGNWDISIETNTNDEIGLLAQSFNKMVLSLRENARIWHEFKVAQDMQAQMLPKKYPEIENVVISAKSIPTKEVGGDFYDFLILDNDRLGVVVGDVSGHGVSAAMVMTAAMGAMRFAAEEKEKTDEVLAKVNQRLGKDIQKYMFVALFYAIYEPTTQKLFYTNAGQTMPYLLRNGEIHFLPQAKTTDRFPLGIIATAVYEQLDIQLQSGDKIIFYTDGMVDAMNNKYESYGFDRFSESIQSNSENKPDKMIEVLMQNMQSFSNGNFQDDVTIVILEIK